MKVMVFEARTPAEAEAVGKRCIFGEGTPTPCKPGAFGFSKSGATVDMTVVVDAVRWQELVVPIIHFYAVMNGVFGRVSFVPLEDVQPPIVIGNKRRTERLLAACLKGPANKGQPRSA